MARTIRRQPKCRSPLPDSAGNLTGTDTDVQTALDTIDGFTLGGGGVSTFVALTDTPAAITADECVLGNAAGDALTFGSCVAAAADGSGREDLLDELADDDAPTLGIGTLAAAMTQNTTIVTINAASTVTLELFDVLQIEDEFVQITTLTSQSSFTFLRGGAGHGGRVACERHVR